MRTLLLFLVFTGTASASGWNSFDEARESILFHAINLAILFGVGTWLLRGKIRDALANRAGQIKRDIDESNKARKDARHRYEELEARLTGFERELQRMRAEAEEDAEKEKANILVQAGEDAERIQAAAERTIRDETARARASLRREAAQISIDLARERLEGAVDSDDQARLTQDFLSTVQSGGEVGNG
jgi:F-type H+-transporting ATPase subunit b